MPRDKIKQAKSQHLSYLRNKDKIRERSKQTRSKWRATIGALKDKPCLDCGVKYPWYVMQFDHREDEIKIAPVSTLLTLKGLPAALEEIKKCDLVCSNCHAIRTWNRIQHKKNLELR